MVGIVNLNLIVVKFYNGTTNLKRNGVLNGKEAKNETLFIGGKRILNSFPFKILGWLIW